MILKNPPAIALVAFNRPKSLSRLLKSLAVADYKNYDVPLIISIDRHSDNQNVLEIANNFEWPFGKKTVVYQNTNLGLRKHIIKTGELSYEYDSIIVLEDDLFVAPGFYNYAIQAINFSLDKDYIGGISLYNYQINTLTGHDFNVNEDGYDNWYFQYAASWGQAWTKEQFKAFLDWYNLEPSIERGIEIPKYVISWSHKSWLKYYIAYLVEKNKFFLYPKIALSTNFADMGTHAGISSTMYQASLSNVLEKQYFFSELKNSKSVYDSFFENLYLHKELGINKSEMTLDLNGYRKNHLSKNYILTTNIYDFKIIKSYEKSLKPIENNIINALNGNEIFLYDTSVFKKNPFKINLYRELVYSIKYISLPNSFSLFLFTLGGRLKGYYYKILIVLKIK